MPKHCQTCGEPMENLLVFPSNVGYPDEVHECFGCHADGLLHNTLTACMGCGSTFSGDHLLQDPVSGEKNICPYCRAVWSEQRRISVGRT